MSSKTPHGSLPSKEQEVVEEQEAELLKEDQEIATPEGQEVPTSTPPPPADLPSGKLPAEKTEVF